MSYLDLSLAAQTKIFHIKKRLSGAPTDSTCIILPKILYQETYIYIWARVS